MKEIIQKVLIFIFLSNRVNPDGGDVNKKILNMNIRPKVHEAIYKAMGIDWNKTYMSPIARPVYIANGFDDTPGIPVKELI